MNKTLSAKATINDFNEFIDVITHEEHLTKDNAMALVKDYDVIMDGLDNPKSRYILNDACVLNNKPLVSGSALKWEGMASVYNHSGSSCYRCVYPTPTPAKLVTNCADGGVIGMIPGIIGQLEALEIVKIILGEDGVLSNKMVYFNGKTSNFKTFKLRGKQKNCVVCGDNPSITDTADYDYDSLCPAPACSLVDVVKLPEKNDLTGNSFPFMCFSE
jgi:adenylyltransferase and sulfurtransferase